MIIKNIFAKLKQLSCYKFVLIINSAENLEDSRCVKERFLTGLHCGFQSPKYYIIVTEFHPTLFTWKSVDHITKPTYTSAVFQQNL